LALPRDVTQCLIDYSSGDRAALDEVLSLVYAELRRIAASYLRRERRDHTLQPTALVHEAYMRLVDQKNVDWRNRAQFFGLAAEMMRRILINHALEKQAAKRGGGAIKITLSEVAQVFPSFDIDLIALDEAMKRLADIDPRKSRLVELKFFGGLTIEEITEVMEISTATVEREWAFARAWLYKTIVG
jgi:RNA polymerase sigma factor (TIGR02999 family)